ncbi:hypothetical protein PFICI_13865 [Pestalotiopsis fici W106-1]|uniref:Ornithine cyclodeaminase n=1 Tax=Pestalotiopsis fici (strain W106-1 / CGMCC3.15140) TaxID=1229662 RepID=W3WJQ1_PESFW|nr:uncharacterized protein PFICI_13865 [Pestalotiopsis fici W106-1]ETS73999.1 hypothetical protein PFICI_13865 [Pestalotiopsis fici W106-1]
MDDDIEASRTILYLSRSALRKLGIAFEPQIVTAAVEHALADVASNNAVSTKFALRRDDTKLSALGAMDKDDGIFKIISSSEGNRARGLPRSNILLIIARPPSFIPSHIIDGTEISLARTASFPIISVRRLLPDGCDLNIFIFGASALADMCIRYLVALCPNRIRRLAIKGRGSETSAKLAAKYREAPFLVEAVNDLKQLPTSNLVITATSSVKQPLFQDHQIASAPVLVVMTSEGDEIPDQYCEQAIRNRSAVCDDWAAVRARRRQSIAKYIEKKFGSQLPSEQPENYGIKNLEEMKYLKNEERRKRWIMTSVGSATTDLAVVKKCCWHVLDSSNFSGAPRL